MFAPLAVWRYRKNAERPSWLISQNVKQCRPTGPGGAGERERMGHCLRSVLAGFAACLVAAPAASAETARYILPPGNFGGLPTTPNSLDQLPLYDGLTPLRGNVDAADIDRFFLPEDFKPIGATREEPTGRARACGSSTTPTACPTSTATPATTCPSAPAG